MAQSVSFNMERTYFCPGEEIDFTPFHDAPNSYTNVVIKGPYNEYGIPIGNLGIYNWFSSFYIRSCSVANSGYYYATIGGVPYDTVQIYVLNVDVHASASDTIVSPDDVVTLTGSGADYYSWSSNPPGYLDAEGSVVQVNFPQNVDCIDFIVAGTVSGDNRVVNGDFEDGNTEFSSAYLYNPPSDGDHAVWDAGYYTVHDHAVEVHCCGGYPWEEPWNHGHPGCGSGKYMIINGDAQGQKTVWQREIQVRQNVRYAFSANVCNLDQWYPENRAILQFSINGRLIGDSYLVPLQSDGWDSFYAIWESDLDQSAIIRLVNLRAEANAGNDFGVDNITFKDLMECTAQDTVTVCVECNPTIGNIVAPAAICDGGTLVVSPPSVTPSNPNYTYHWEIAPSSTGPWQTLSSLSGIPSIYYGWYLHYVVTCSGQDFYSNSVPIVVFPDLDVHIVANDSVICEGESVTLTAEVDSVLFIAPGDILCTDNTIVKADAWPVSGKTPKGIVFYVDNTGQHGWAVNLHNEAATYRWATVFEDIASLSNYYGSAFFALAANLSLVFVSNIFFLNLIFLGVTSTNSSSSINSIAFSSDI